MSETAKRDQKKYWLDEPKNVDKIVYAVYLLCFVLIFGADFFYKKYLHFDFEGLHGFYGWYGLIGSVSLVLVSKLMRKGLMRDEDYYDEDYDDE